MSRWLAGLCVCALLAPAPASAAEADARQAVQQAADEVLVVLRDPELPLAQKRKMLEDIAYSTFDFERMARLALARSYKKFDKAQRADFQIEFRRHLALTYGRNLGTYSDESIEIDGERAHKNGDITVSSVVVGGKQDGASIDYRMRVRDTEWKVIDVVVEGVSLVANFRAQVKQVVAADGPAALIAQMRANNDKAADPPAP